MTVRPEDVLGFWLGELDESGAPKPGVVARWFRGGSAADREIGDGFGDAVAAALAGELADWESTPRGRLALVVLLDQFTRNLYRGQSEAFSGDAHALALSRAAIDAGEDRTLQPIERYVLYMPLEHAEDLAAQRLSVERFGELAATGCPATSEIFRGALEWAERHCAVIERFGRFPSRNGALGRTSTADEKRFLAENPSGF